MALATVVSVLAALGALAYARTAVGYARDTVRETRELRREDRLARLPELLAELGETALLIRKDPFQHQLYEMKRFRLGALLAATPEVLPLCHVLAQHDGPDPTDAVDPYVTEVQDALFELGERLAERRG